MALEQDKQIEALAAGGVSGIPALLAFKSAIESQKNLNALSEKISKDADIKDPTQAQFLTALAQKWKQDPQVFAKIEAELAADPSLGDKLIGGIKSNPASALQGISQYNGTNLAAAVSGNTAPQAPQNAPAAPAPGGPTTTAAGVPVGPPPTTAAPSPVAAAAAPVAPPANDEDAVLDAIIRSPNKDISAATTAEGVKLIAGQMAKLATGSYGVSASSAEAFKKKIDDPKSTVNGKPLAEAIADNLKKNPDFVRQMAMLAKDKSPMSEPFKSRAQQEMSRLMANPELLASEKYVQEKQQQFAMAQQLKNLGLTGIAQQFLGESLGPLKSAFADMGNLFAGFRGEHQVISMASGGGLFPTMMINLDAFEINKNYAMAWNRYSPLEMTAGAPKGADGKFFHNGNPIKGPDGKQQTDRDGKPMFEQVPNGQITIKTADGKDMKVIPSVGTLVAKQQAGTFDSNGKFIEGNYRVPVVTDITEHGVSNKIQVAIMTPAQFAEYKKQADAAGQRMGGSIKELEVETYTAADAQQAGRTTQVVSVNPQSGAAGPPVQVAAAPSFSISMDPNLLNPNAPQPQRV